MKLLVGGTYGYTRFKPDGRRKFHGGIDLYAPVGTECYAVYKGRVVATGIGTDFGNYVIASVDLADGKIFAVYAHLSKVLVTEKTPLESGTIIGKTGTTGNSSPDYPHLHFELWKSLKAANAADREAHRIDPLQIFGPIPFEPFASEVVDAALSRA